MSARLHLLWYHAWLSLSWSALLLPLALVGTIGALTLVAPAAQRNGDLSIALEGGLPVIAGLLAAPLLVAERERGTLPWLASRVSLFALLALRLGVLVIHVLACCGCAVLVAGLLWHIAPPWDALPRTGGRALAFIALALLAASWGRSLALGYLAPATFWLGTLVFGMYLPHVEPWLTLNPFAWSAGFSPDIVTRSTIVYALAGSLLLVVQWPLLRRPGYLLRPT